MNLISIYIDCVKLFTNRHSFISLFTLLLEICLSSICLSADANLGCMLCWMDCAVMVFIFTLGISDILDFTLNDILLLVQHFLWVSF